MFHLKVEKLKVNENMKKFVRHFLSYFRMNENNDTELMIGNCFVNKNYVILNI